MPQCTGGRASSKRAVSPCSRSTPGCLICIRAPCTTDFWKLYAELGYDPELFDEYLKLHTEKLQEELRSIDALRGTLRNDTVDKALRAAEKTSKEERDMNELLKEIRGFGPELEKMGDTPIGEMIDEEQE